MTSENGLNYIFKYIKKKTWCQTFCCLMLITDVKFLSTESGANPFKNGPRMALWWHSNNILHTSTKACENVSPPHIQRITSLCKIYLRTSLTWINGAAPIPQPQTPPELLSKYFVSNNSHIHHVILQWVPSVSPSYQWDDWSDACHKKAYNVWMSS